MHTVLSQAVELLLGQEFKLLILKHQLILNQPNPNVRLSQNAILSLN